MNQESTSLDLSWIEEEETLLKYQSFLHPSPLDTIMIQCIFVDGSNNIVGTERLTQELEVDNEKSVSILSVETLTVLFTKYSYGGPSLGEGNKTKYLAEDVLLYNVDISTEQLQTMADIGSIPLKSVWVGGRVVRPISIPASLVIFHSIQTIYIFMREVRSPKLVKSILKHGGGGGKYGNAGASTKRVRIHPDTFKPIAGVGMGRKTKRRVPT